MKYIVIICLVASSIPLLGQNMEASKFLFTDSAITKGSIYQTQQIYFNRDSKEMLPQSQVFLDSLVLFLKQNDSIHLLIFGHYKNNPDLYYSQSLSQMRSQCVWNYLVEKGIASDRLVSKGDENTEESIHRAEEWMEFVILDK